MLTEKSFENPDRQPFNQPQIDTDGQTYKETPNAGFASEIYELFKGLLLTKLNRNVKI